jgi:hypothetical protein
VGWGWVAAGPSSLSQSLKWTTERCTRPHRMKPSLATSLSRNLETRCPSWLSPGSLFPRRCTCTGHLSDPHRSTGSPLYPGAPSDSPTVNGRCTVGHSHTARKGVRSSPRGCSCVRAQARRQEDTSQPVDANGSGRYNGYTSGSGSNASGTVLGKVKPRTAGPVTVLPGRNTVMRKQTYQRPWSSCSKFGYAM